MDIESLIKPILRGGIRSLRRSVEEAEKLRNRAAAESSSLLVHSQPEKELHKAGRRMTASALLAFGGVASEFIEALWSEKDEIKRRLLAAAGELPGIGERELLIATAACLLGRPNDVCGARQRLIEALHNHSNQVPSIVGALCLRQSWSPEWLDENRARLLGTALAYAVGHAKVDPLPPDIESVEEFLPEVLVLRESFLAVQQLSGRTPVSFVIAMWGEQAHLSEYVTEHVIQLETLRGLNEKFDWSLRLVCDGDDMDPGDPARSRTSVEVVTTLMHDAFFDSVRQRIHVLQLPQDEKERIGSKKGGAIIYGIRHALDHGAKYVLTNDIDFAFPLFTAGGHLLHLEHDADITIASRWHQDTVTKRPLVRWAISALFAGVRTIVCPELGDVIDTQAAMKGFTTRAADHILPLSSEGQWEISFDYGLSFDIMLLARAAMRGLRIREIRSILYWSQTWGAIGTSSGLEMGCSVFEHRALLNDEVARKENALALIGGGYNFRVYSRSDLEVVIKVPKVDSPFGRLFHRAVSEFQDTLAPQTDLKRVWTHGLMGSAAIVELKRRLPLIPPLLKSAVFDVYRLLSPGGEPLAGYLLAIERLGGLSLELEIVQDVTFSVVNHGNIEKVYMHQGVVQQKIPAQNTVASLLQKPLDEIAGSRALIARVIEFQESLWRRGVFDRDVTNLLQNVAMTDRGKMVLIDPDDLTDDIQEAVDIVEREKQGLTKRVDVQLLSSLSEELGQYYLSELRRTFAAEHLRNIWATEAPVPVAAPSGEYPVCESADKIDRLYELLVASREKRPAPVLIGSDVHENR